MAKALKQATPKKAAKTAKKPVRKKATTKKAVTQSGGPAHRRD